MEYLDNLVQEALSRYFTVVEKTGYVNDADTCRLIFLGFLQEFLEEYQYYITEDDYKVIINIINCLSGSSCLIPYAQYIELSTPVEHYLYNVPFKVSQSSKLRFTEDLESTRLVNQ